MAHFIDIARVKYMVLVPGHPGEVVIACHTGLVAKVDLEKRDVKPIVTLDQPVRAVAFLPDGRLLVGGDDLMLRVFSGENWSTLDFVSDTCRDYIRHIAVHDNEVLTSSDDLAVRLWRASNESKALELVHTFGEHEHYVMQAAWHPKDRGVFATACLDTVLRVFHTEGAGPAQFRGHTAGLNCVAFHEDGKLLFTGSDDHTVKVWSTAEKSLRASLEKHAGNVCAVTTVTGLAGVASSTVLVSVGEDGFCHAWRIDDDSFAHVWSIPVGTAPVASAESRWQSVVAPWNTEQLATWIETTAQAVVIAAVIRDRSVTGAQFRLLSPTFLQEFSGEEVDHLMDALAALSKTVPDTVAASAGESSVASDSKEWEGPSSVSDFNGRAGRCWCVQPFKTSDGQQHLAIGTDAGLALIPLATFAFTA